MGNIKQGYKTQYRKISNCINVVVIINDTVNQYSIVSKNKNNKINEIIMMTINTTYNKY